MPDITMCEGGSCKIKEECFRYTAEPNPYRQSYADFYDITEECEYFIDNKKIEINKSE